MQTSARYQAIAELIEEVFADKQSADNILNIYFRERRFIGSKDRKFISEEVWKIIRHRRRLEFEAQSRDIRKILLVYLKDQNLDEIFAGGKYGLLPITKEEKDWLQNLKEIPYPPDVEAECPKWLYDKIKDISLLKSLNTVASADFRINAQSRQTVIQKMKDEGFDVVPTPFSPIGIRSRERVNLNNCMTFQDGLIEPQDEASQLVSILCDVNPEHKIIDYCCGGGGKSLALAYLLHNKGTIEAHDVDIKRMDGLDARMKRLQISNIVKVSTEKVSDDYDRFVIDAPCSGSGTWRRSPDAKFRLSEGKLAEITSVQAELLKLAADKVKIGGQIIYITCSVLEEENKRQIDAFLAKNKNFEQVDIEEIWNRKIEAIYPFESKNRLQFSPAATGTDGFFVSILRKKQEYKK